MPAGPHDVLELAIDGLFRRRGVLDPSRVVPGLGASLSESLALGYLAAGPCVQHELGSYLGLEKSTVSRLVAGMTEKGWVERARCPDNRRFQKVVLTAPGERAAAQIAEATKQRHERWFAALTEEEHKALSIGLPALLRAMAAEDDTAE
ncbi:MarR family winged helix-turn-helix transcriptional regulator [Actinacidiphila bryophytorum]|uniref:DNA-binding transcriptional regulator, MarR family n=1 Tax=Actinacidiphila bryophytorum TaxID=1436133 RepID=A0A9W4H3B2_9ACTN|nr:MarR family transcriptional regulator [Actinacidiphila bryophytorum]MBM9438123.1 MarR family transcriptional regulator [Actinacidiphila bryophytorum]MBN6545493.1 MarR family transcriptional regulator [Actinacidiphila bryophytorum]CAG7647468.1 DNA-binding transcriptional regulator, MarR family [Actinacidiphila bryophytorum]